jgi:hypothetical protein
METMEATNTELPVSNFQTENELLAIDEESATELKFEFKHAPKLKLDLNSFRS